MIRMVAVSADEAVSKVKSINRRGRKGKTQSSQRAEFMCFNFALFATS
jgi:hypothetical protein